MRATQPEDAAMLVLFDIDGTLLRTRGAGVASMEVAGRSLFHEGFSMAGVDFAGRLDPLIWRAAAEVNGIADHARHEPAFRAAYADAFAEAFRRGEASSAALTGVGELLTALVAREVDLGIVTGNYPETGAIKLREAGLEAARFTATAWGSDGGHRRELPPLAIDRHAAATGRRLAAERVVVIGDTPHDVDCARHASCRSIAVATGPSYDRGDLERERPDLLVDDLGATADLVDWILADGR